MIVPMKKAMLIILSQDNESALKNLRELGVLHIEHIQPPLSKDIALLKEYLALVQVALAAMGQQEFCPERTELENLGAEDCRRLVNHIISCRKRIEQLQDYSRNLSAQINQWERWGDFDPEEIKSLREKGIYIKLYQILQKDLKDLPQDLSVSVAFTLGKIVHCAIAGRRDFTLPFKEVSLPRMSLSKMRQRLSEEQKAVTALREDIRKSGCHYNSIAKIEKVMEKDIEFQEAIRGMGQAGELAYLSGYIPFDKIEMFLNLAKSQKWGVSIEDPREEDNVPTLIRNPRWISLINPVFRIIEVIPGYREFDISLWFLLFLSVFFGILIGDAGYGIIYFVITAYLKHKFGQRFQDKTPFYLAYILSFCAIVWGVCTATFFGQQWLASAGIKPLVPALTDDTKVRSLCFLIGVIHLSIAHLLRIMTQFPSLIFLAEVGWVLILWSAFFLAQFLILSTALPWFLMWLLVPGMILVVLFSNPRKNIFRGVGAGLGTLALNLMNNFTDVVSYIRLFAVGLAGLALADAGNSMALSIRGSILGNIGAFFVLLVIHGLNIFVLGPLSVLVHGVRLNVLEFCTHLDVKWSGFAYRPLKENVAS